MTTASLLQFLFSGLMVGAIYGLVALGLNIVFKSTGAVNFAQGEFAMLGGMLGASSPLIVREIMRLLAKLRDAGTTILLVEQNARMALRAADRAYVLETGSVVLSGTGAELLEDDQLKAAYLGG